MSTKQPLESRYLSIAEVAQLLGVHRSSVDRLMKSRQLPYVVIGEGRKMVSRAAFEAYCDAIERRPARKLRAVR